MKTFYRAAAVVTAFSVLQRGLGFLYRIVLSRTVGSEGMGLYQIAVTLFMVILTASSSGIPITVSRLLTKYRTRNDLRSGQASLAAGLLSALSATVLLSALLLALRAPLSLLFSDERAETVFFLLLPGLGFSAAHTVLRGYFWGNKYFFPYSVTELVEEMVMILVGTALVYHVADPFSGAARAAIAVTVSNVASFTLALVWFLVKGGKLASPKGQFRPLLSAALPISAMRTSAAMIDSVIAVLLPARLQDAGMTGVQALRAFGVVTGMAIPVLSAPSSLIGSFALVLVPELAENYYRGRHRALRENVEEALSLTSTISCIFIPALLLFGREAGVLLFSNPLSGEIIRASAYLLLPLSLNMMTSGLLNSMQGEKLTLLAFVVGSVLLLLCICFLPARIGIYAMTVGMAAEAIGASAVQLFFTYRKCVEKPNIGRAILLPLALTAPVILVGIPLRLLLTRLFGAVPCLLIGAFVLLLLSLGLSACFRLLPVRRFGALRLRKKREV